MKINVYYEDNRKVTVIEAPDEECEIWVETDYRQRLAAAEDKSSVKRRTPQQIMDEECNRPTYNNQMRETRRHVSLEALDPLGDTLVGAEDIESLIGTDETAALHEAIGTLNPQQRDLVRQVFWGGIGQAEIAHREGVTEAAVSRRMSRIYKRIGAYMGQMEIKPQSCALPAGRLARGSTKGRAAKGGRRAEDHDTHRPNRQ